MILVDGDKTKNGLKALRFQLAGAIREALRLGVEATDTDAKSTTLFEDRSHRTRDSIKPEIRGRLAWVRAGGAAKFLENGTPPHDIVARRAKMLRFQVNGQTIFRRSVRHPGTAERPFMQHARDRGEIALDYALDLYINAAIHDV